jgi:hypothetical protein
VGQEIDVGGDQYGVSKIAAMGAKPVGHVVKDQVAHEIIAIGTAPQVAGDLSGIEEAGRLGHAEVFRKNWPERRP